MKDDYKICPILTAGAFANVNNTKGEPLPCYGYECELWDEETEMCVLCGKQGVDHDN